MVFRLRRQFNILKVGYNALHGNILPLLKEEWCRVDGMEIKGDDGPATGSKVAGGNDGLFCVCGWVNK